MNNSIKIRLLSLVVLVALIPQNVLAITPKATGEMGRKKFGTSAKVAVGAGVLATAGIATFPILKTVLSASSWAALFPSVSVPAGVGAGAGLGIASGGIALGVGAGVAAIGVASYYLYKNYRTKELAISSEQIVQMKKIAKMQKIPFQLLKQRFLSRRYDQVCKQLGDEFVFDNKKSVFKERKTDIAGWARGKNLTAYEPRLEEEAEKVKQKYAYIKGNPTVLIEKLVCKKQKDENDNYDQEVLGAAGFTGDDQRVSNRKIPGRRFEGDSQTSTRDGIAGGAH